MNKISAIYATYNTSDILEKSIENLLTCYENLEITVVDNASKDGTREMIRSKFPNVRLIESGNDGIPHAYNLGISASTGDYYLFLGSDAFPNKETINGMVSYFEEHPEIGAATPKLVLRDGSLDKDAHRGITTPWNSLSHFLFLDRIFPKSKIFSQYFMSYEDMNKPHEIGACISHFLLVRKETNDAIGGWDEDFWVFGEDIDYCYRVHESRWKLMYLPQFEALHWKGYGIGIRKETKDIKTNKSKEFKLKMRQAQMNGMRLFFNKHMRNKYPALLVWLVLFGIESMSFIRITKEKLS